MISLEAVEKSILELEQRDSSFANCEKLAWCYIVREHIKGYQARKENPIETNGCTELLKLVNGKDANKAWIVIDELMDEVIKPLHPKVYNAVLQKLKEI